MIGNAAVSPCGTWRWSLTRDWDGTGGTAAGRRLAAILLNPSTADAGADDPTLRRLLGFARAWGFGGLVLVNLFALRATDPRALRLAPDPLGPRGEAAIDDAVPGAAMVLCAWGNGGAARGAAVAARLRAGGAVLWHLGLTAQGAPRHPLYAPRSARPCRWDDPA